MKIEYWSNCKCQHKPNLKDWILVKYRGENRDIYDGDCGEYEEVSYDFKLRCPVCGEITYITVDDFRLVDMLVKDEHYYDTIEESPVANNLFEINDNLFGIDDDPFKVDNNLFGDINTGFVDKTSDICMTEFMSPKDIVNKFTEGEIISYAEIIRRLPNHFLFREQLLEIPHRILSDNFKVHIFANKLMFLECPLDLTCLYPKSVVITFNTFDIESIEIVVSALS